MHKRAGVLSAALGAAAVLCCTASAQEAQKLQYRFKPGETVVYEVREKTDFDKKLNGLTFHGDWQGRLRLKVLNLLPNGDAELEASYDSGTLKLLGQTREIKAGEIPPLTFVVTASGRIRDYDNLDTSKGFLEVTSKEGPDTSSASTDVYKNVLRVLWQPLPDRQVKRGEKWTQEVLTPALSGAASSAYELTSTDYSYVPPGAGKNVKGVPTVLIERKLDSRPAEPVLEDAPSVSEQTFIWFSPGEARVQRVHSKARLDFRDIDIPDEDGNVTKIDLRMTTDTEIFIPAPGAATVAG